MNESRSRIFALTLVLLPLFIKPVVAQELNFKITRFPEFSPGVSYEFVTGKDSTGYYFVTAVKHGHFSVGRLDNNFSFTGSVETPINKHALIVNTLLFKNEIACLYTVTDNEKMKKELFVDFFSTTTLARTRGGIKLAEIYFSVKAGQESAVFHFRFSEDLSKILIFNEIPMMPSGVRFLVFDRKFNLQNSMMMNLSLENKKMGDWDVTIENSGIVAVAAAYTKTKSSDPGGKQHFLYLTILDTIPQAFKRHDLPIGSGSTQRIGMLSNGNTILCYDFGVDKLTVFRYSLASGGVERAEFNDNQIQARVSLFSARGALVSHDPTNELNSHPYLPKDIIFRKDGSILIVSEQVYNDKEIMSARFYHHDNIQLLAIDSANGIAWATRIIKKQSGVTSYDSFVSYSMVTTKDNEFLLLNEYQGDGGHLLFDVPEENKINKNSTYLMSFDKAGHPSTKKLFSIDRSDAQAIRTWPSYVYSGRDAVFISVRTGIFKIAFY